jgi:hypothetical protein
VTGPIDMTGLDMKRDVARHRRNVTLFLIVAVILIGAIAVAVLLTI